MILSLIVAYAKDKDGNLVIGKGNEIPWYDKTDLLRFKEYTMDQPIIMGRKTHESIGRILPGRKNIVVTRQDIEIPGAVVVHSMEEALSQCKGAYEPFIIGGQSLYEWALDRVERMYITELGMFVNGDAFFPPYKSEHFKPVHKEGPAGAEFTILQRYDRRTSAHKELDKLSKTTYTSPTDDQGDVDHSDYIFAHLGYAL